MAFWSESKKRNWEAYCSVVICCLSSLFIFSIRFNGFLDHSMQFCKIIVISFWTLVFSNGWSKKLVEPFDIILSCRWFSYHSPCVCPFYRWVRKARWWQISLKIRSAWKIGWRSLLVSIYSLTEYIQIWNGYWFLVYLYLQWVDD